MDWWDNAKRMFGGPAASTETAAQSTVGPAASTTQSSSYLGTAPESPGYTATGARRLAKSRKSRRSKKKTRRSRKH
jgi:hypothetical protein